MRGLAVFAVFGVFALVCPVGVSWYFGEVRRELAEAQAELDGGVAQFDDSPAFEAPEFDPPQLDASDEPSDDPND